MHRVYVASMFFLLAALTCIGAGGYYYLDDKYPTDEAFIRARLDRPEIADTFKVDEARKANYKDEEIVNFLAGRNRSEFRQQFKLLLIAELTVLVTALLVGGGLVLLRSGSRMPAKEEHQ